MRGCEDLGSGHHRAWPHAQTGAYGRQGARVDPTGRDAPSAFCGPVLPDEAADTGELRDIRSDKRFPDPKRLSSDQEVIRADWRSCRFQRGAQITGAALDAVEKEIGKSVLLPRPLRTSVLDDLERLARDQVLIPIV
ncbi:MAG: hypothetical protein ACREX9_10080 [Gammaproteobacteria bacterium]